ncbi:MAG: hypothetical protein M3376_03745 [Actinomycetota bacterium]|nr:hypothetical protein [Actinomycetota bacterium]
MVTKGLLVRLDGRRGKDDDVEQFLLSALPLVRDEAGTIAWFAIRLGRSDYGIVDVFADDAARDAHLSGPVATALMARADELFESPPEIMKLEVLASKLPDPAPAVQAPEVTKGLLLTFKPKPGDEGQVAGLLRATQPLVEKEDATIAWFALALPDGQYGSFDVFPDNAGRLAHLSGRVPRELAKHAKSLSGGLPDMDMLTVLAAKLPD